VGHEGIDIARIAASLVVLLFSLSLHESAHAWAADRLGDPTGRLMGRVSLNPLVHIDPIGTILFPLIGFLVGGAVFGWAKPVAVNLSRLADPRRGQLLISAAGPVSNLLAAVGFGIGLKLMLMAPQFFSPRVADPLWALLSAGLLLNIILAVFNLIPIPPLDGSWILEGILPASMSGVVRAIRPFGFLLLLLLLYSGFFGAIIRPVMGFVGRLLG